MEGKVVLRWDCRKFSFFVHVLPLRSTLLANCSPLFKPSFQTLVQGSRQMGANLSHTRKNLALKVFEFHYPLWPVKKNPAIAVFDKNDQLSCVQNGALSWMKCYFDSDCTNAANIFLRNLDEHRRTPVPQREIQRGEVRLCFAQHFFGFSLTLHRNKRIDLFCKWLFHLHQLTDCHVSRWLSIHFATALLVFAFCDLKMRWTPDFITCLHWNNFLCVAHHQEVTQVPSLLI